MRLDPEILERDTLSVDKAKERQPPTAQVLLAVHEATSLELPVRRPMRSCIVVSSGRSGSGGASSFHGQPWPSSWIEASKGDAPRRALAGHVASERQTG